MNIRTIVVNALLAGIYIAMNAFVLPISFYQLQFRISETLNHLLPVDRTYFPRIVLGVLSTNPFLSPLGAYAFLFPLSHTAISLATPIYLRRLRNHTPALMR